MQAALVLMAGENRAVVETVLAPDHPRNHLIQRYLESKHWEAPAVIRDFDLSAGNHE